MLTLRRENNDNGERFVVRQGAVYGGRMQRLGWYVYRMPLSPGDRPITINLRSKAEAIRRRDAIEKLYERFGW